MNCFTFSIYIGSLKPGQSTNLMRKLSVRIGYSIILTVSVHRLPTAYTSFTLIAKILRACSAFKVSSMCSINADLPTFDSPKTKTLSLFRLRGFLGCLLAPRYMNGDQISGSLLKPRHCYSTFGTYGSGFFNWPRSLSSAENILSRQ